MIRKLSLAAGLMAMAALFVPRVAAAAPLPQSTIPTDSALVRVWHHGHHHHHHRHHHHHWRHHHHRHGFVEFGYGGGHCRHWRNVCADRWGWHTRGYHRCLWRHGC
ncbi:MAG: hypothetical protein F9K29_04710 [Hyphomicrobiaceae bacterium]|nr:MAG: hypothetical protein F9K29_04710 [Hyphomicrobiaceae bacterium]